MGTTTKEYAPLQKLLEEKRVAAEKALLESSLLAGQVELIEWFQGYLNASLDQIDPRLALDISIGSYGSEGRLNEPALYLKLAGMGSQTPGEAEKFCSAFDRYWVDSFVSIVSGGLAIKIDACNGIPDTAKELLANGWMLNGKLYHGGRIFVYAVTDET